MTYFTSDLWEIVLDAVALLFCFMTLFYIVGNKIKSKDRCVFNKREKMFSKFDSEMLVQLVKQQSEKSFEAISHAIMNERDSLLGIIEKGEIKTGQKGPEVMPEIVKGSEQKNDPHVEVVRMNRMGFSTREISETTKMPRGEVDLIIKLKNMNNEYVNKGKTQKLY